jgi:hypothetical protein
MKIILEKQRNLVNKQAREQERRRRRRRYWN